MFWVLLKSKEKTMREIIQPTVIALTLSTAFMCAAKAQEEAAATIGGQPVADEVLGANWETQTLSENETTAVAQEITNRTGVSGLINTDESCSGCDGNVQEMPGRVEKKP
jgi:hypothetical protein